MYNLHDLDGPETVMYDCPLAPLAPELTPYALSGTVQLHVEQEGPLNYKQINVRTSQLLHLIDNMATHTQF